MLKTQILIGLFVLKNNGAIREQKVFREGRTGNCPHMLFFGGGYGQHRKLEGFSHGWLQAARVSMGYAEGVDVSKLCRSARPHPVKCPDMWIVIFTSSWLHVALAVLFS